MMRAILAITVSETAGLKRARDIRLFENARAALQHKRMIVDDKDAELLCALSI